MHIHLSISCIPAMKAQHLSFTPQEYSVFNATANTLSTGK